MKGYWQDENGTGRWECRKCSTTFAVPKLIDLQVRPVVHEFERRDFAFILRSAQGIGIWAELQRTLYPPRIP
jgi:hypothetical protein